MGDRSLIEWTDATWNPVSGCTKLSRGCKFCYAEKLFARPYPGRPFTDVREHPDRLDQPLRWKRPRRIFVNSMSDLFHERVDEEFICGVFRIMAMCPQHTFQVLTKRPARMRSMLERLEGEVRDAVKYEPIAETLQWPLPHVWLGVSVEDQAAADERIRLLAETSAAVRFLSCEPLLGLIDLRLGGIDWVIAGGESGSQKVAPCRPDWVRSVRDQCVAAGVPFFFKQWGHWKPLYTQADVVIGTEVIAAGSFFGWAPRGKKHAGRELDGRTWDEFPQ